MKLTKAMLNIKGKCNNNDTCHVIINNTYDILGVNNMQLSEKILLMGSWCETGGR